MEIIIPNVEGLPEGHFLNVMINATNRGGLIDEVYAASTIAGFSQFLAERPEIASGQDWINRTAQLVSGIEVNQAATEGLYKDLVECEEMELRLNRAQVGGPRSKLILYFLSLTALASSGLILYKIYMVYNSTGEVILGDILLFVAILVLAIVMGIMGYKKPS